MGKIIGIDLGTSNSAASVMVGGKPTIIQAVKAHRSAEKPFLRMLLLRPITSYLLVNLQGGR